MYTWSTTSFLKSTIIIQNEIYSHIMLTVAYIAGDNYNDIRS